MGDRFPGVLGRSGKLEGLGTVESNGVACFARAVGMCALESGFFGGLGLGIFGCGCAKLSRLVGVGEEWKEGGLPLAGALPFVVFVVAIRS